MACVPLANDFKDSQTAIDPDALEMALTFAASHREDTPGDDEMTEIYQRNAYNHHDALIEMGGRPTRAVLEKPAWKAIYEKDQIRIVDSHGVLECTLAPDENLTFHHWSEESSRFYEELNRWKEFRDYQSNRGHHFLLNTAFDPENMDQRLIEILIRLKDWREFQHYQQIKVGRATMLTWKITRAIGKIMREESMTGEATPSTEISHKLDTCLHQLIPRQEGLETSEIHLTWIRSQIFEILAEACASIESTPALQQQLLMILEQQANAFYQELDNLEARPSHSEQSPSQMIGFAQKICHWGSEISRYMQELWEWKIFLKWRRMQPSISRTANSDEQESSGFSSDSQIMADYVTYRRFQLDRTRNWVACWQRLLLEEENELKAAPEDPGVIFLQDTINVARVYVEKFQDDIHTAQFQIQVAEQQLAERSSQQCSSATVQLTQQSTRHPQVPLSPPKSDSTDVSSVEDTLMIDIKDAVNTSSRPASEVDSKNRSGRTTRKSLLPIYQAPISRKTRSATKLDSGRIFKKPGKKPAKKTMTFTKQQSLTLQNAASTDYPHTGPSSLRRSKRLRKKAAAPAVIASP